LFFTPAVVPCTFIDTAHDPLAASVPVAKLTEPAPAVAVAVPAQVLLKLFGVATTSPAGNVSVNASPVSVTPAFGFVMLSVNDVAPFSGIVAAPNTFVIVGGPATVRFAEPVLPVPPFVEDTFPVVFV